MDIFKSMMGNFSDDIVGAVAKQAGVNPDMAKIVLEKVAPAMTGAMAKNAGTKDGAHSLNQALSQHDGSILDKPESISSDIGAKILGHVFGSSTDSVRDEVSKQAGLDKGTTSKLMEMMAPMVLGSLGKETKKQGLDDLALQMVLGQAANGMKSDSNYMSMAMKFADLDGDGQVVDDLPKILGFLGVAKKFLGRK